MANAFRSKSQELTEPPPEDAFEQGDPKEMSHEVYESLEDDMEYTSIAVLINRDQYDPSVWDDLKEDPYLQSYIFMLERIEMAVEDQTMVFIDSRDSRQNRTVNEAHRDLKENGSRYVNFQYIHNISIPLEDEDSYGLQIADWVCSAVKDAVVDGYTTEFYDHVEPHLQRNEDNELLGCGLKVYPKAYEELHEVSVDG